ncbi:MAG: hypothetical protein NVS3B28_15090 [Candidatus Velthaea sp.]
MRLYSFGPLTGLVALAVITAGGPAPALAQGGWATHRDPSGYIVDVPPGWRLAYDGQHHKVTIEGMDGARVILRMITAPAALDPDDGADIGQTLAKDADPAVSWTEAEIASPRIAVVRSADGTRFGKAFFTWRSTPSLSVGYLYAQTGARSVLTADRSTIKRIFESYRIALPPPGGQSAEAAAAPPLHFASFTEPTERMFTVDLPTAWARTGGLYRQSALDIRPAFRAGIEGSLSIASGDPAIPFFTVPNGLTAMGGMHEGDWYTPGYGVRLMVRRFTDGTSFAQAYAASHFAPVCGDLHMADARARPDAVAELNATYARFGLPVQVSAGEVAFTCSSGGAPMRGYVFAGTQLVRQPTNAIWNVQFLLSYIAKSELSGQAHAALVRSVATYRVDPEWARRNGETVKNISEITTRTGEQMRKIIGDTYWSKAESESRISTLRSNATRGVQRALDPLTQTPMTIDNRYEYNWIDHNGKIVGSDVSASPGAEFRRLIDGPAR